MASNSLTSRLEELRSRNPQSPPSDSSYSGFTTPTRYSASFMPTLSQTAANDTRGSMQRRFTADSNQSPAANFFGQPPLQPSESGDMAATTLIKVQALEKKRLDYERLREQRKRFEVELDMFNRQQAQEEMELQAMANDLHGLSFSPGHQSEPTTPPEHLDSFPSAYARRNRYSSSSLVSPPALNRLSRSGSQITSPLIESPQIYQDGDNLEKLPSKSVPGSRRSSTDRFSSYLPEASIIGQRSNINNRYSMPVTSRKRESIPDYKTVMEVGHINTTGFLFGDDDEKTNAQKEATTSPDVKSYIQMNTTNDKFPILIRNNTQPGLLSASSAALDLALSQSPGPDAHSNTWPSFARHRPSQQSLPQNVFDRDLAEVQNAEVSGSSQPSYEMATEVSSTTRKLNRHSMEAGFAQQGLHTAASNSIAARPMLANLSYSTNDLPTLKNAANGMNTPLSPPKSQAEQKFHIHNASLGRIPAGAVNRLSRELPANESRATETTNGTNGYRPMQSELHASAPPFGPSLTTPNTLELLTNMSAAPLYAPAAYYGGYGMQLMNMGMTPMAMNGPMGFGGPMAQYQSPTPYAPYGPPFGGTQRFPDSQARVIQQRRMQNAEEVARFTNAKIENYRGDIYALCKDQHGCRYLQKQLEQHDPESMQLIFVETNPHVVELMTDPFGNYLCQKLLEFANDEQRTVLINNAAPQMVQIALNQHGTRALQKMIEYISTPEQIQTIIHALKDRVVELIKDLNGNHVIQKCLNRLTADDAQFIFDAVGGSCVAVGTHRHGCCVLQRCIDHASGPQKAKLIHQITQNAYSLVQDAFGNYVLQYIVDLQEPSFTHPLCYSFRGQIPTLSKQKFSSNVVEKCLRGASHEVSATMIEEMLNANELERMLRDSFANYVVQTALDYADPMTRARLIEAIRPILPSIRQTPYGRRIASKIMGTDPPPRMSSLMAPVDIGANDAYAVGGNLTASRQLALASQTPAFTSIPAVSSFMNAGAHMSNKSGYPAVVSSSSIPHHSMSNGSSSYGPFGGVNGINSVTSVQQPVSAYGRGAAAPNGFDIFF